MPAIFCLVWFCCLWVWHWRDTLKWLTLYRHQSSELDFPHHVTAPLNGGWMVHFRTHLPSHSHTERCILCLSCDVHAYQVGIVDVTVSVGWGEETAASTIKRRLLHLPIRPVPLPARPVCPSVIYMCVYLSLCVCACVCLSVSACAV